MGKHKSEKRTRNVVSSDEEEAPDPKTQKSDGAQQEDPFDVLFNEEERLKLNSMTEKERETEIFKRIEMNQIMKTREEIKKKLEMTQKAEEKKSKESASSSSLTPIDKGKTKKPASSSESSAEESSDADKEAESSSAASSSDEDDDDDAAKSDDDEVVSKKKSSGKAKKLAVESKRRSRKDAVSDDEDKSSSSSDDDDDDEDFDTEFHRPSELAEKSSKKRAMYVLLSKRRDKKEAEEKRKQKSHKAKFDINEIFGDDDNDDGKSSSSSSSSSRSSSPASSRGADDEPKPEITSIGELLRFRISRYRLAQHVHAPYFKELAVGCFVRIGIGSANDGIAVYRVAQIVDVVETAKIYQVENTRTNKGLRLRHGADERVYRLEFISNSEFSLSEFQHWVKAMRAKDLPLPTIDTMERKEAVIKRYRDYTLTNADVDQIVKEKSKFSKAPSNFAFQKGELMKKKEYAEQCGDVQQVHELQAKIDALDTRADQLDRQRSQKLSVVTWINQRNRDHMKESFLGANVASCVSVKNEDDPFTRKSNRMRVVSGRRSASAAAAGNDSSTDSLASGAGGSPAVRAASGDHTPAAGFFKTPVHPSVAGGAYTTPKLPSAYDLFSAHDIDIDISINLPTNTSSSLRAGSGSASAAATASGSSSTPRPSGTRSISIEEYKRKRGLL